VAGARQLRLRDGPNVLLRGREPLFQLLHLPEKLGLLRSRGELDVRPGLGEGGRETLLFLFGLLPALVDLPLRGLFLAHLLANEALLLFLCLQLLLVLVGQVELLELEGHVRGRDMALLHGGEAGDILERFADASFHDLDVVVLDLRDRRVALAVEGAEH